MEDLKYLSKMLQTRFYNNVLKAELSRQYKNTTHMSTDADRDIRHLIVKNNCSRYWLKTFGLLVGYSISRLFKFWEIYDWDFSKIISPKKGVSSHSSHGVSFTYNRGKPPRIALINSADYKVGLKYKKAYNKYKRKLMILESRFKRRMDIKKKLHR